MGHTLTSNTYKDSKRVAPKPSIGVDRATLETAVADFNRAAGTIGFSQCATLTEARAKALGYRVLCYTPNELATVDVLEDWGVDCMITDAIDKIAG